MKKIAFLDILRCVLKKLASLDTATFSVTDWLEEEGLLNQIFRFHRDSEEGLFNFLFSLFVFTEREKFVFLGTCILKGDILKGDILKFDFCEI